MDFIASSIQDYADSHTQSGSELLDELFRHTQTQVLQPRMISSKIQGRFLSMISKIAKPTHILEIGTYTGYSALCLAEGLQDKGMLHTIDINDELRDVQELFIGKSDFASKITLHTGNALDLIPTLSGIEWDLVFIDADKDNYSNYYDMVLPLMKKGGIIIADNVLWSGKVTDPIERQNDLDTKSLHLFNEKILADKRVENILLPFRDGLMMARVI